MDHQSDIALIHSSVVMLSVSCCYLRSLHASNVGVVLEFSTATARRPLARLAIQPPPLVPGHGALSALGSTSPAPSAGGSPMFLPKPSY